MNTSIALRGPKWLPSIWRTVVSTWRFAVLAWKERGERFCQQQLMTDREGAFYEALRRALPLYQVFPQVAVSALLAPRAMAHANRRKAFGAVAHYRVDYAVVSRSYQVVCVIELGDKSSDWRKEEHRDRCLEQAGIRTLRWDANEHPTDREIHERVIGKLHVVADASRGRGARVKA